jgi:hypothetical protein
MNDKSAQPIAIITCPHLAPERPFDGGGARFWLDVSTQLSLCAVCGQHVKDAVLGEVVRTALTNSARQVFGAR